MTTWIEQALVIMSGVVLLVPLFQRLGFGSVLGYLLAGVVVGPHGLGWIGNVESIAHFSEFGVVFLLFIIGLEIEPRKLWSMRRHLLGLGGLQVVICTAVFTAIALALGWSWAAAVVVAFALSLSSTAFAIQMLVEKNFFNTEFGRGSFAVLLAQDLMAIPALALIPLLVVVEHEAVSVTKVATVLAVLVSLVVASRFLIRPLFRLIAATRSRDMFTVVALSIVIGVAALMHSIGLSSALGAFIAGVLLADSEYRHELEINIEPFKGLLMGLFFVAVGMGVSVDLVLAQPVAILGSAIGYLSIKSFFIYGVGRWFGYAHSNAKPMALSIAQGGEFAFVIFGVVAQLGLLPTTQLSFLTAVITLSMALNPLLILLEAKWSQRCVEGVQPQYDQIKDEAPVVIIAGFGRFGQIFGRVLRAQKIPFVAIDHDATQIELLRKFGNKVYYGDAARSDLLEMAGAARAKYFVLAIDDVEVSLRAAKMVKTQFAHLKIFARARNRGHAFDLMELGVELIKRETFDSSIFFVRDLLLDMGFAQPQAERIVARFREHDEIMLREQFKVRGDDKTLVSVSKQGTAQLAAVLSEDNTQSHVVLPSTTPH